ncbi:hypothetical protein [Streptomyces sp. YIM 98790]|uniref:hypothetical protein n=1 Tax=Streptomyces sp. YIM 98790 TaxID=2689077 RepID=UPI001A9D9B72|nr:hypothetical protein [Streptomyces sp. YIM 98790]
MPQPAASELGAQLRKLLGLDPPRAHDPDIARMRRTHPHLFQPEVRMVRTTQLHIEHTFSVPGLDGVRVSTHLSAGAPHGLDVRFNGGPAHPGVTWSYDPAANVVRLEHTTAAGAQRWELGLDAHHQVRQVVQGVAPGGGVGPSGSGPGPAPGSGSGGGAVVAAGPSPLGAPQTVRLAGRDITLTPGAAPGGVVLTLGGGPAPPGMTAAFHGRGGVLRVEETVNAHTVRRWDFTVGQNNDLHFFHGMEELRLADGTRAVRVGAGIDITGARTGGWQLLHADAATGITPGGTPRLLHVGGADTLSLPTGAGYRLYDPATGRLTHDAVRLAGDGAAPGRHVLTGLGDGSLRLADADAAPVPGLTVVRPGGGGVLHVGRVGEVRVGVYGLDGRFLHEVLPVPGTALPGGFVRLPGGAGGGAELVHADGTPVRVAGGRVGVVAQPAGGWRIEAGGVHLTVDAAGRQTHEVTVLTGADGAPAGQLVHTPVGAPGAAGPGAPTLHAPDGHRVPGLTVTRILDGTAFRVSDGGTGFRVHTARGAYSYTATAITGGSLDGSFLRTGPGATGPARLDVIDARYARVDAGAVAQQGNGFRVHHNGRHQVLDAAGVHTHDAVHLTGNAARAVDQYVLTPAGAPAGTPHTLHAPDGAPVPGTTVIRLPDGGHHVLTGTTAAVHLPGGALDFDALRMHRPDGTALDTFLRVHPSGFAEVLDADLTPLPGTRVTPRPGGAGHRIEGLGGGTGLRLTDAAGRIDVDIRSVPAVPGGGPAVLRVHDGNGTAQFDVVRLSDAAGTRFVRTTGPGAPQLLDGELAPVPNAGFTALPGGGYRLQAPDRGFHAGEFREYDAAGNLTSQRVNLLREGALDTTRHIEISYPPGATPTWTVVRTQGGAPPANAQGARRWFDAGTVDLTGAGQGHIRLLSHSGTEVFSRRPLPDGTTLDSHLRTGAEFGITSQRTRWHQTDAQGTVIARGTRHWGQSGRSWFDVGDLGVRVRHFQILPDGSHVLAGLQRHPWGQSFGARSAWHRYDADYRLVATGTREWGPGRGFTDVMPDPRTGNRVVMHEKWGRFTLSPDDNRQLWSRGVAADGSPGPSWLRFSPHGKESGTGRTLPGGGFLESHRFAEQRPPALVRSIALGDHRAAMFTGAPHLRGDSALQVHTWQLSAGPGGPVTDSGIRFVSSDGASVDLSRTGEMVRSVRKLPHGTTLRTGDEVALPSVPGITRDPAYAPWSEGPGNLGGHRTHRAADFDTTVPGRPPGGPAIHWQDRFTNDLHDGDWYSPAGTRPDGTPKTWHVARTGLADGSVIEYRPRPRPQPAPGAAGPDPGPGRAYRSSLVPGQADWTRYDHQGIVVGRQDTWPGGLTVTSHGRPDDARLTWTDSQGRTGTRVTAFDGKMGRSYWDRESYRDFQGGELVREYRMLGDGVALYAWRTDTPAGAVWHWNKTDRHGTVLDLGSGPGQRLRIWHGPARDGLPGTRFEDVVRLQDGTEIRIQEIPALPATGRIYDSLTDAPFRVREYVARPDGMPAPGAAQDLGVWREFDNGAELRTMRRLPDGTFLEREPWQAQWRRYAPDANGGPGPTRPGTLIGERTITGMVWDMDPFGRLRLSGREVFPDGFFNEYRGFTRMLREPNRWRFGRDAGGESLYTPFVTKASGTVAVEFAQEWIVDFTMSLAVYAIVASATGVPFTPNDVLKALLGATVSAGLKGGITAAHLSVGRGGVKTRLSETDRGNPGTRRPFDEDWTREFGGNEKVLRWRAGAYDYGMTVAHTALAGFVNTAANSALFGVRDANGNTVHLSGLDALREGAIGMAAGLTTGVTTGLGRFVIQQNIGGRFGHRGGFLDTLVVPALGKLADKTFTQLYLLPTFRMSPPPAWFTPDPPPGTDPGGAAPPP